MGFFNRKKKASPSPAVASSPVMQEALPIPTVTAPQPPIISYLKLLVVVDRAYNSAAKPTFHIHADPDAPASSIKGLVEAHLGGNVNAGCYKTSIPFAALDQARTYTERFGTIVDFISVFPSFNLHDPEQLMASFGGTGWSSRPVKSELLVRDWFPLGVNNSEDEITILARTVNGSSSSRPPLTLLAHLAPSPPSCALNPRASPDLRGSSSRRQPHCRDNHTESKRRQMPILIDITSDVSVADLKMAVVRATGVDTNADLDKVVAWQVDMTAEEMIVIEERGGLKHGQMPWPYPPTALVPVILNEHAQPITRFFTRATSNTQNVSLSIWVHPSIAPAEPEAIIPPFSYPMNFAELDDVLARTPSFGTTRSTRSSRSSRPSTAPAAVHGSSSIPAFGASRPKPTRTSSSSAVQRSSSRTRVTLSPLATTSFSASDIVGLGIAVDKKRLDSISSYTATDSSDSELSSRCSSVDPVLKTPRDELPPMLLSAQRSVKMDYFTRQEFA